MTGLAYWVLPASTCSRGALRSLTTCLGLAMTASGDGPGHVPRNGQGGWLRTSGLMLPKHARYQTALHPDAPKRGFCAGLSPPVTRPLWPPRRVTAGGIVQTALRTRRSAKWSRMLKRRAACETEAGLSPAAATRSGRLMALWLNQRGRICVRLPDPDSVTHDTSGLGTA